MALINPGPVNASATLIPDGAEVWLALKSSVTDITSMIPATPTSDLAALGWLPGGYIDDKKGISLDPTIEVKEYDAFGHPKFRVKLRNGKLVTGFTLLETNATTKKVVLPGSAPNKIGAPKDVQVYVLYRWIDEDRQTVWVQLTPAPVEQSGDSGVLDGELRWFEMKVHHTTNADGDVFQVVDSSTDDVLKTVTIPDGGPLSVTFTGPVTGLSATGTGGTVTVA